MYNHKGNKSKHGTKLVSCSDRLPKASLVKLMALEADILANKAGCKSFAEWKKLYTAYGCNNKETTSFLQSPGDNSGRHLFWWTYGNNGGGGGDTATQVDVTKDLLNELA